MKKLLFVVLLLSLLIGCGPKVDPPQLISENEFWTLMNGTWSNTAGNVFIDFRTDSEGSNTFASGIWQTEAIRLNGVVSNFTAVDIDTVRFDIAYPVVEANMMHDEWPAINGTVEINYTTEPLTMMVDIDAELIFNQLPDEFVEFTKGEQLVFADDDDLPLNLNDLWLLLEGTWHENNEPNHSFVDFGFNSNNEPIFATGGYPMTYIHREGKISDYEVTGSQIVQFDVEFPSQVGMSSSEILPIIKEQVIIDLSDQSNGIRVTLPDQICHCGSSYSEYNYQQGVDIDVSLVDPTPSMTLSELWTKIKGSWYYLDYFWFVDFRFNNDNEPIMAAGSVQVPGRQNCLASELSQTSLDLYEFTVDCDAMTINSYLSFPVATAKVVIDMSNYPAKIKVRIPGEAFSIGANYVNEDCVKGVTMNLAELLKRQPIKTIDDLWTLLSGYWVDQYQPLMIVRGTKAKDVYVTFTKNANQVPIMNIGLVQTDSNRLQGKVTNFTINQQNAMKFSFDVTYAAVPANSEHELLPAITSTISVGIDKYPNFISITMPAELSFSTIPVKAVNFQEKLMIIKLPDITIKP
jgi:hypothetical protein